MTQRAESIPDVSDWLGEARRHFEQGRYDECSVTCRRILRRQPAGAGAADARHLLGLVAFSGARYKLAERKIRQAIALSPGVASFHSNLGLALQRQGRLEAALNSHQQALQIDPAYARAHNNTGLVMIEQGKPEAAASLFRRAIELDSGYAEAYNNLGKALLDLGRWVEAEAYFKRALELRPGMTQAHNNLGTALYERGELQPAKASYEQSLRLSPTYSDAYNNLGVALHDLGDLDGAEACLRRAITLRAGYAEAYNNLANVLADQGNSEEAIAAYEQALQLKPSYSGAHFNLALTLLRRGDFERGWEEYEARWQWERFPSPRCKCSQPLWHGQTLRETPLLVHAEQGFGDTIQFIRYMPYLRALGTRVILECQPELKALLQDCPVADEVVSSGAPLPQYDAHVPLLSLPRLLRGRAPAIPCQAPYLHPSRARIEAWSHRLPPRQGLRVGLVWAGNPRDTKDRGRSLSFDCLAPVTIVPGVTFFSLQKGDAAEQLAVSAVASRVVDLKQWLSDFAETAAAMRLMDLVVTVDTASAHLAGALGVPVWILLRFVPDWRWFVNRDDSPWYPSARLFRQDRLNGWEPVVARAASELRAERERRSADR